MLKGLNYNGFTPLLRASPRIRGASEKPYGQTLFHPPPFVHGAFRSKIPPLIQRVKGTAMQIGNLMLAPIGGSSGLFAGTTRMRIAAVAGPNSFSSRSLTGRR